MLVQVIKIRAFTKRKILSFVGFFKIFQYIYRWSQIQIFEQNSMQLHCQRHQIIKKNLAEQRYSMLRITILFFQQWWTKCLIKKSNSPVLSRNFGTTPKLNRNGYGVSFIVLRCAPCSSVGNSVTMLSCFSARSAYIINQATYLTFI